MDIHVVYIQLDKGSKYLVDLFQSYFYNRVSNHCRKSKTFFTDCIIILMVVGTPYFLLCAAIVQLLSKKALLSWVSAHV